MKILTETDRKVYEVYARDGYDSARAFLVTLSEDELATVQQRSRYANELAELEILNSPERKRKLKLLGF